MTMHIPSMLLSSTSSSPARLAAVPVRSLPRQSGHVAPAHAASHRARQQRWNRWWHLSTLTSSPSSMPPRQITQRSRPAPRCSPHRVTGSTVEHTSASQHSCTGGQEDTGRAHPMRRRMAFAAATTKREKRCRRVATRLAIVLIELLFSSSVKELIAQKYHNSGITCRLVPRLLIFACQYHDCFRFFQIRLKRVFIRIDARSDSSGPPVRCHAGQSARARALTRTSRCAAALQPGPVAPARPRRTSSPHSLEP